MGMAGVGGSKSQRRGTGDNQTNYLHSCFAKIVLRDLELKLYVVVLAEGQSLSGGHVARLRRCTYAKREDLSPAT